MIKEKISVTLQILENNPQTRGDRGTGEFLNIVAKEIYKNKLDFRLFNTESWTRARRKVLEVHPELDNRTYKTFIAQRVAESEVA